MKGSILKVLGFNFELTKSADWQYYGRCVEFTLKMNLSASTPLSVKALAPYVGSIPQMRILESTLNKDNGCVNYTGSYKPTLTSRNGDIQMMDDLKIDLGQVTVVGSCKIEINIKFQLLKTASFVHGRTLWPGFSVQYANGEYVYATQQAVQGMVPRTKEPVLALTAEPVDNVIDTSKPVVLKVKAVLDCTRTFDKAKSTKITIRPPDVLVYNSFTVNNGSIAVTKGSGVGTELVFETSSLVFKKAIDFDITFTKASSYVKQGRDVDFVTFYADATAMPVDTGCPTAEDPFTSTKTKSTKMYTPFSTCDSGPGVGSTNIAYQSFSALSYGAGAGPDEARFTSSGAWKPSKSHKRDRKQYLQVSFTSTVKIRRFAIKGKCDDAGNDIDRFVKSLKVYYSNNGGIWKPIKEGSKVKVFEANINCKGVAIVPLPYDIETKYIRVCPVDFENAIGMKVEFYGCKSTAPEFSGPLAAIPNRSLLQLSNVVVVCNTWMDREIFEHSCFSTSDGNSWKGIHKDVKHVSFTNPADGFVYAVGGQNGKLALRNTKEKMGKTWDIVSKSVFTSEKAKAGIVVAVLVDNVTLTDDDLSLTPSTAYTLPANPAGSTWGITGQGVYSSTNAGVKWDQKAVWLANDDLPEIPWLPISER